MADLHREGRRVVRLGHSDVHRDDEDGGTSPGDRRLAGENRFPKRLLGRVDHVTEDRALTEERLEVDFLYEMEPHLFGDDLGGQQDYGRPVPVRFIEPVYEVEASRSAGPGHGGEAPHQLGFRLSGEGSSLLVPHVHPIYTAALDVTGNDIQSVPDDPVAI
ncbi:MAG TPA: hypothetical protein VGG92_12475, partial [Caulobacteraceae bacterium]